MQSHIKIFEDIGTVLTLQGAEHKSARHVTAADLSPIHDAVLVSERGKISWIGPRVQFDRAQISGGAEVDTISLNGATVLPGFVECHTHTVFAGRRSHEFEWRMQGQTYQEISAQGGGILSTVKATRAASAAELQVTAQLRVNEFVRQGVTTVETKTGYGLDLETELKCLAVARSLKGPRVVSTYLGAHSRSPDYPDLDSYMRFMIDSVLPHLQREKLTDRVDIYIEKGFYGLDLARAYCERARELGFPITAHVEQLSDCGGTDLVLSFQPQSVDHVVFLKQETIARVAQSQTTAVLLPTSDFYLKMRYPPARALIDAGARVALSTDYNPGTSPTQSLSFAGVLARIEMKMSLAEVIAAYTIGAAYALGLEAQVGSLVKGKQCDFTVLDCPYQELFFSVGGSPVASTYRSGERLTGS